MYPHEERISFGEPGNIFKAFAICGTLRMNKIERFQYSTGEYHNVFVVTHQKFQWKKKHQNP